MALLNALYPHILPADIPVWQRYLAAHPETPADIDYDVRVGVTQDPGPAFPDNIRQMAITLAYKRIDAVIPLAGQTLIIEITRRAGLKAVGQLITYPLLYALKYPQAPTPTPLLVAEELLPDTETALIAYGIKYELYPPIPTALEAPTGTIGKQPIPKDAPNE
jgi:hypothetical protein